LKEIVDSVEFIDSTSDSVLATLNLNSSNYIVVLEIRIKLLQVLCDTAYKYKQPNLFLNLCTCDVEALFNLDEKECVGLYTTIKQEFCDLYIECFPICMMYIEDKNFIKNKNCDNKFAENIEKRIIDNKNDINFTTNNK